MPGLFDRISLRGLTVRNRIAVSPMCQYSATDGTPTDWHLVHLGSRAAGGAGLVMAEASAVSARGRITPGDLGIYSDSHVEPHARIVRYIVSQGAAPAIQLAHAGRKASSLSPWEGGHPLAANEGAWQTEAPSAIPFSPDRPTPTAMEDAAIEAVLADFVLATKRAVAAGYQLIELHGAHGYLMHSFCSPLSNRRNDSWGGDFAGRTRFARELARRVREAMPDAMPLAVRISHTDWMDGGWTTAESVQLAGALKDLGVDLMDVSSGGTSLQQKVPLHPGYQVPGAAAVRAAGIATAAVGLITEATHADAIIQQGQADMVFLARVLLRDPYWPLRAAETLAAQSQARLPVQYARAWGRGFTHDPVPPAMRQA
jgi:2,4-dienoyl-CoA reductase-like NADH-dependent reductase (Old Yellow Enzyme family)